MSPISLKKVMAVVMIIVFLSQLHHVLRAFSIISNFIFESLPPSLECPDEIRYAIHVGVFLIVFMFLWKLFVSDD